MNRQPSSSSKCFRTSARRSSKQQLVEHSSFNTALAALGNTPRNNSGVTDYQLRGLRVHRVRWSRIFPGERPRSSSSGGQIFGPRTLDGGVVAAVLLRCSCTLACLHLAFNMWALWNMGAAKRKSFTAPLTFLCCMSSRVSPVALRALYWHPGFEQRGGFGCDLRSAGWARCVHGKPQDSNCGQRGSFCTARVRPYSSSTTY